MLDFEQTLTFHRACAIIHIMKISIDRLKLPQDDGWTTIEDVPNEVIDAVNLYSMSQVDKADATEVPEHDLDALLEHYDELSNSEVIAAKIGDEVAGIVSYHHQVDHVTNQPYTFIEGVAVSPEHQKRGVAGLLAQAALKEALSNNSSSVRALAQPSSLEADTKIMHRLSGGKGVDVSETGDYYHISTDIE